MGSNPENSLSRHHISRGISWQKLKILRQKMNANTCVTHHFIRMSEQNPNLDKNQNLIHTDFCYVAIATIFNILAIFSEKMFIFWLILPVQHSHKGGGVHKIPLIRIVMLPIVAQTKNSFGPWQHSEYMVPDYRDVTTPKIPHAKSLIENVMNAYPGLYTAEIS